jgi:hypothetical protein
MAAAHRKHRHVARVRLPYQRQLKLIEWDVYRAEALVRRFTVLTWMDIYAARQENTVDRIE